MTTDSSRSTHCDRGATTRTVPAPWRTGCWSAGLMLKPFAACSLVCVALLSSGCSNMLPTKKPEGMEVTVSCTKARKELTVNSWWWIFAVTTKVAQDQADVICRDEVPAAQPVGK